MKKNSIVTNILILLMFVIILQSAFSLNTIIWTDITSKIESFSYNTFTKTVQNRKSNLESFMNAGWANIGDISESISKNYIELIEDGQSLSTLTEEEKTQFLSSNVDNIIDMISKTRTTGGFIILNDGENMKYNYSSLYLKNETYLTQNVTTDSVMLVKGSTEISKEYGFSLSRSWSYALELDDKSIDILNTPIEALNNTENLDYLGYWAIIPDFSDPSSLLLTYTVPILDENNEPIGIIGVEISQDYLYKFLPSDEFGDLGSYGYIFAEILELDDNTIVDGKQPLEIKPVMLNGSMQNNLLSNNLDSILLEPINLTSHELDVYPMLYKPNALDNTNICMYLEKLSIYPNNTPFEGKSIWIVGMVDLENITHFTNDFWHSIFTMFGISLISGLIISYFAGKRFATPIIKLSNAVSKNDVRREINLPRTNIKELDDLANVIEQLQQENMIRNSNKTDKILELLNIGVGSFEYIKGSSNVSVSQAVYSMLKINNNNNNNSKIEKDLFFYKLNFLKINPLEDIKNTYFLEDENENGTKQMKYYTIQEHEQEDAILGVIEDVTKEVEDLLVLNYERNYDLLTGIFNRRAFHQKVEEIFNNDFMQNTHEKSQSQINQIKESAFVMFDLDNLKYVNDTFGHDSGDIYIKTAATIISTSLSPYGVVGRMSGDEFYAYLHDINTKEEIRDILNRLYKRLENEPIELPNAKNFQIRMSGGIAWYNQDSTRLDELIKYADFAMYKGKKNLKGELREFDKEQYIKESFMLSGKEELNKILDNEDVEYVFQPIINVKTDKIYAYEALMRPVSDVLNMPDKFLQIASLEGKLWKVEKITFSKTLFLYKKHQDLFKGVKLFINSIPTENLLDEEYLEIQQTYREFLPNVVVEITEQEQQEKDVVDIKLAKLKELGVQIALDDYGSGYSNDVNLLNLNPNIVKIDRSLISNVHIDPSRQTIVNKIISFCKENNICVLGEGIETAQEYQYLVEAGIELAQGYYISRPIKLEDFNK